MFDPSTDHLAPDWATTQPASLAAAMLLAIARSQPAPSQLLALPDSVLWAAATWPGQDVLLLRLRRALDLVDHPQASLAQDAADQVAEVLRSTHAIARRTRWLRDAGRPVAAAADLADIQRALAECSDAQPSDPVLPQVADTPAGDHSIARGGSLTDVRVQPFTDHELRAVAEETADSFLVLRVARSLDQDAELRARYGRVLAVVDAAQAQPPQPALPWQGQPLAARRRSLGPAQAGLVAAHQGFADSPRYETPPVQTLGAAIGDGIDVYAVVEHDRWVMLLFGPGAQHVRVHGALQIWPAADRLTAVVAPGPVTLALGQEEQRFLMPPIPA